MKKAVFWDIKSQFVPYRGILRLRYNRLMLRNIWDIHGGDYEEQCLLGFKIPVHTSQEIYYVSATEPTRLISRKILSFHDVSEERQFLKEPHVVISRKMVFGMQNIWRMEVRNYVSMPNESLYKDTGARMRFIVPTKNIAAYSPNIQLRRANNT
jgi:hypothetical protein